MTTLFRRSVRLEVGGIDVSGLRFQFRIEKDLLPKPNQGEIRVFNLAKKHQAALEAMDKGRRVPVRLLAGYGNDLAVIFQGDLRYVRWEREGPQTVAIISSGDGLLAIRGARVSRSFAAGTPVSAVLRYLAEQLGVGLGNAEQAFQGQLGGQLKVYSEGTVVSGQVSDELKRILDSVDLEYSIQNGALQILPKGGALKARAIVLSPKTGLIGSPSMNTPAGFGGSIFSQPREMTCTTKLIPDLFPGRLVKMEAEFIKGLFRVWRAEYVGDTHGQDWNINLTCRVAG